MPAIFQVCVSFSQMILFYEHIDREWLRVLCPPELDYLRKGRRDDHHRVWFPPLDPGIDLTRLVKPVVVLPSPTASTARAFQSPGKEVSMARGKNRKQDKTGRWPGKAQEFQPASTVTHNRA
jgi:hypothetical protein